MRHRRFTLMLSLLVGVIIFGLRSANMQPALAQDAGDDNARTLSVIGTGSASGTPDVAFIDVGIEVEDANVATAVEQVNQTMEDVTAALGELDIPEENIQTTSFNIRQDQAPPTETDAQSGYVASSTVKVQVTDISQMSNVIQTALDAGANRMYGLQFGLQDTNEMLSEARQMAVDDAQMRAEELAQLFGITLGDPIQISEGGSNNQPIPVARAGVGGAAPPVINEGQLSVSVQLNVTYEIVSPSP